MQLKICLSFASVLIGTAHGKDFFLASKLDSITRSSFPFPERHECPPLKWIKQGMSSGTWILNYTDLTWGAYMNFLGVDQAHWNDEFNASDIWQYSFYDETFIMNHTIPMVGFHLLYEASLKGVWEKNPYPYVTPAGFDKHAAVDLSNFRNVFEKPGIPHADSCWALRTDMPVVSNHTGKLKEYIVTFWRELTTPSDMRATLHIYDAKTMDIIEPWKSQLQDASPTPGFSYRYFRRTVQSFEDVVKRWKCRPTGEREGTYFC
jgi:hypothetical protein